MRGEDERTKQLVDAVARRSYGKLIAFLAARSGDVAAAEDALSEAFTAALSDWPAHGLPHAPEAWLLTVARRKVIDAARKRLTVEASASHVQLLAEELASTDADIPDERLALMFACAHPAIEAGVRAPLVLQVILGLNAKTIASSFLTSSESMSKRLVRAKEKIRRARIPFVVPDRQELSERLNTVIDSIYAAFGEGWTDPGGTDLVRRDLTDETIYLARLLRELLPAEPETSGLLALMLYTEARRRARRDAAGEYVPLGQQDTALWDSDMIAEAENLLHAASTFGAIGRYQLEAALQSAHVHRCRTGQANWVEIVDLYDALATMTASPVVAVNRAVALAELQSPSHALAALGELASDQRLAEYQPYWAARAELLARAGALADAHSAYERAIGLERDPAVRRFLQRRQAAVLAD